MMCECVYQRRSRQSSSGVFRSVCSVHGGKCRWGAFMSRKGRWTRAVCKEAEERSLESLEEAYLWQKSRDFFHQTLSHNIFWYIQLILVTVFLFFSFLLWKNIIAFLVNVFYPTQCITVYFKTVISPFRRLLEDSLAAENATTVQIFTMHAQCRGKTVTFRLGCIFLRTSAPSLNAPPLSSDKNLDWIPHQ